MKAYKYTIARGVKGSGEVVYLIKTSGLARVWYTLYDEKTPKWRMCDGYPLPLQEPEKVSWLEILLVTGLSKGQMLKSVELEKERDQLDQQIFAVLNHGSQEVYGSEQSQ